MVTHLSWTRASAIPVLVAKGITSVRDEGGDLVETAAWATAVAAGSLSGPTIFQVGPMLNGSSFNRYQYAVGSAEQARGAVRLLKFEGVNGLEIEQRNGGDALRPTTALWNQERSPISSYWTRIPPKR
jgi:hypothetical protein